MSVAQCTIIAKYKLLLPTQFANSKRSESKKMFSSFFSGVGTQIITTILLNCINDW